MNRQKTVRILGVFYIVTILVVGYFAWNYFGGSNDEETPEPSVSEGNNPIPSPSFSNQFDNKSPKIQYAIKEFPSLPQRMKVFEISNEPYTEQQVTRLASALGFKLKPITYDSKISGMLYIYSENQYMRVSAKDRTIDYKSNKGTSGEVNPSMTQETAAEAALEFMKKLNVIDTNLKVREMKRFSSTNDSKIDLISISFVKNVENVSLNTSTYETGAANLTLNSRLDVLTMYVDDIAAFQEKGEYTIKSENEIKETLQQASIQSIRSDSVDTEYELEQYAVRSITVDSLEISYVEGTNSDQNILQPVFVLRGRTLLDSSIPAEVILYLPALSRFQ